MSHFLATSLMENKKIASLERFVYNKIRTNVLFLMRVKGGNFMDLKIINTIRTNNFNDERMMEKISDMWKSASANLNEIKHEGSIYGLYYEYESDYKGDYTLSVAIDGNDGFSITIPDETKYKVFTVNKDSSQGVFNTWNEIWKLEKDGNLNRTYTYDYEKYYIDGGIEIFIAVSG